jgi:hypothetical protein
MDVNVEETYLLFSQKGEIIPVAGIAFFKSDSSAHEIEGRFLGSTIVSINGIRSKIAKISTSRRISESFFRNIFNVIINKNDVDVTFEVIDVVNTRQIAQMFLEVMEKNGVDCCYWDVDWEMIARLSSAESERYPINAFFRDISVPRPEDSLDLL